MIHSKNGNPAAAARLVPLASVPDGNRFRLAHLEFAPGGHTTHVSHHLIGLKLYGSSGSVRVRLPGKSRHVIFNGSNGKPAREFDSEGTSEVSYPTMLEVEDLGPVTNPSGHWQDDPTPTPEWRTQGGAFPMDKQTKALIAKLTFQQAALAKAIEAGDEAKAEMAQNRINAIEADAAEKGISLTGDAPAADPDPAPEAPAKAPKAKPNGKSVPLVPAKPAPVSKAEQDQTKQAKRQAAEEARKAHVAKAKEERAAAKAAKPKAASKAEKLEATRDCLCGCGLETYGFFRPGHDARVKGMLLKVERGLMGADELPESLTPYVKFAGRKATAGQDNSDYRVVKSPVKFPAGTGHDEVEVVKPA